MIESGITNKIITDTLTMKAIKNSIALIQFNTNREVIYVNDNFAHTLGYSVEEMYGKKHNEFCFPEFVDSPQYEQLWNELLDRKVFQDKIVRKNAHGKKVWLEATYFPIMDAQNKEVLGVAKIATDITQRQINIEEVADTLQKMSAKLILTSEEGIKKGNELLMKIEKMVRLSKVSTTNLEELQKRNEVINGITGTIQNIASQTKLLGINASIEAAIAKEYGRGFEVIAKEIGLLSQKVSKSTNEVRTIVTNVTNNIETVVEGNNDVKGQIVESKNEITVTIDYFDNIVAEALKLNKQANKFSDII